MIQSKVKVKKPAKKKARKTSSRVRPAPPFVISPEDIAEMSMFGEAIAKMNVAAATHRRAETHAKAKAKR